MPNLSFNILTFNHPKQELAFYFSNEEIDGLHRVHKNLAPKEVIDHFGEQDHYYTSFDQPIENGFSITKLTKPQKITITNDEGEERKINDKDSCFRISILKRFYNLQIQQYFSNKGYLVKPNFIDDAEVWLPSKENDPTGQYKIFEKYTLRVQFAVITDQPELLVTYAGKSKVFLNNVSELLEHVSPTSFNWVIYNKQLHKYHELPDNAKRELEKVFPVWNFDIRNALHLETEAPDKGNKYIKFKSKLDSFIQKELNTVEFKQVIPIESSELLKVKSVKIGKVSYNSNQLLFGNKKHDIVPYNGIKAYGPLELSPYSKIHFFYILHKDDIAVAKKMDSFFQGKERGFPGLYNFSKTAYHTEAGFSITFENKENPIHEVESKLNEKSFEEGVRYIAIYLSPIGKDASDPDQRLIYFRLKELLLKRSITSQVLDSSKILTNDKYYFSMPNIAIAILAKLDGQPWRLDRTHKKELIVGVGAFRHIDTNINYIGSAFSFENNGKFNRFECFRNDQTEILAGSIIRSIKEYVSYNSTINRLIIHFFKNMSQKELDPIEKGLKNLGLEIPVFIVSINKTESHDIVAFDNDWSKLMPESGTYINIGWNKYLLFNNTRYNSNNFRDSDGFPFPIKLKIDCTDKDLAQDTRMIKELIDQVYQFSRMYWKSVKQQNLPVTIKYPEMVAEMFPYFDGNEIPDFGKENLWFL